MLTRRVFVLSLAASTCMPMRVIASSGTPIQGTSVGLDHEPEGIIAQQRTDERGKVLFKGLPVGRYTVCFPDMSVFKGPVAMEMIWFLGGHGIMSAKMMPGRGRGYAMDDMGRRIVINNTSKDGWIEVLAYSF